ncbi:MAG: penicillin acylase family protein [Myxococcales bacterium]|nr:penicillin acylase family protein [Myxococcales bacterium]
MRLRFSALITVTLALASSSCSSVEPPTDAQRIEAVPLTSTFVFPDLGAPVHVVRTEGNVPHIYAHDRTDLARLQGYVTAVDRFFMMDLARRLGKGTLSEVLGEAALAADFGSRGSGMSYLGGRVLASVSPELGAYFDAFAAGINQYIAHVASGDAAPPSEFVLAQGLLAASSILELMKPFDRSDVAAMIAVVIYETSYESGDVGRDAVTSKLGKLYDAAALDALREAGALEDIWLSIIPIEKVPSAEGPGTSGLSQKWKHAPHAAALPDSLVHRATARLAQMQKRLLRDQEAGFGSNAWAVGASASTDGAALLAGDGHLSLAVPSLLFHEGLDTSVFGGGATHQLGLTIPGFPVMPIGTNGKVAWSQTQLGGDVTDWYREVLTLDPKGLPMTSLFKGSQEPLVVTEEVFVVADVPALASVGRTEKWARWVTFDGRWLADIEGRDATKDEVLAAGESLVNLQGSYVVPGDTDGDGIVTGLSFDYTGFDAGSIPMTTDALGHAGDVLAFREGTRGLVAYSQNFAVADSGGRIFYTSYQPVPCRGYLPRAADGSFLPGADPNLVLDGTKYGAFEIPVKDGVVDESPGMSDPARCVIPFDAAPQSIDPKKGFVATANNDPGGLSFDGSVTNDEHYFGGPWDIGFRIATIATALEKAIAEGRADVAAMAEIQGNTDSALGALYLDELLASVSYARALPASPSDAADQRVRALYQGDAKAIDEVETRLTAWKKAGFRAKSGVETFYDAPTDADRADAVGTMLFNVWMPRVLAATFDDEKLDGLFRLSGGAGRVLALYRMLRGRGAANSEQLASFHAATKESAFFDVLGTDEVETSHELVLAALVDGLAFLESAPSAEKPGEGGFGTTKMDAWLWGLRHQVRFDSLLGEYVGAESAFTAITGQFAITTKLLPLAPSLPATDPRAALEAFPRDGDQYAVDAGNPGFSGVRFHYGSGPVMRMVVRLKGDEVTGQNVIPGGQSSLLGSEHFADQAVLWLGNETIPMRFHVADVIAGAQGHELYTPQ